MPSAGNSPAQQTALEGSEADPILQSAAGELPWSVAKVMPCVGGKVKSRAATFGCCPCNGHSLWGSAQSVPLLWGEVRSDPQRALLLNEYNQMLIKLIRAAAFHFTRGNSCSAASEKQQSPFLHLAFWKIITGMGPG